MRDFRDAKAMARALRTALAAKGFKVTNSESLELIAALFGARDWNTLAATIKDEGQTAPSSAPPPTPPPSLDPESPRGAGHVGFSDNLEVSLHRAVRLAVERRHQYSTLEHLLLALIDDADAAAVLRACQVDLALLKGQCSGYVDTQLGSLVVDSVDPPAPTAGFHRVIQRAVIHVRSSGRDAVTGANVLVAIFSERESHACAFLAAQKIDRYDAVNFIAHGIVKGGGKAA